MLKGKLFLNNEWILMRLSLSGKVIYKTEKNNKWQRSFKGVYSPENLVTDIR
ncbi:MAG: hypothetical protein ABDK78_01030 [Atribacterota bacterium]